MKSAWSFIRMANLHYSLKNDRCRLGDNPRGAVNDRWEHFEARQRPANDRWEHFEACRRTVNDR